MPLDAPNTRARLSKSLRKVETHPEERKELLKSTAGCFALSISGKDRSSPALCMEQLFPSCFPPSRQGRDAESWPANSPSSVLARATSFDPFQISPRCFKPQHPSKEDLRSQHCRVRRDANIQSLLLPLAVCAPYPQWSTATAPQNPCCPKSESWDTALSHKTPQGWWAAQTHPTQPCDTVLIHLSLF